MSSQVHIRMHGIALICWNDTGFGLGPHIHTQAGSIQQWRTRRRTREKIKYPEKLATACKEPAQLDSLQELSLEVVQHPAKFTRTSCVRSANQMKSTTDQRPAKGIDLQQADQCLLGLMNSTESKRLLVPSGSFTQAGRQASRKTELHRKCRKGRQDM